MAIKSTYQSSGSLEFGSDSSQASYMSFSSQMVLQHQPGSSETYGAGYYATYSSGIQSFTAGYQSIFSSQAQLCTPVVTAATSGTNPAFCHLVISGSSQSALNYYLEAPRSPYGQRLTVKCLNTSTSSRQGVWASTDGSITWDGTNQVAIFSSSSAEVSNSFQAIAISSQRWHISAFSTVNLLLSTQSS